MKRFVNVFVMLMVAVMLVACGGASKIIQTAPCEISVTEPVAVIPPAATLVKIVEPVMFDWDSFVIRADQEATINRVVELMAKYPDVDLILDGFASVEGPESHNIPLSQNRADAVEAALVERGVSSDRIKSVVGQGETEQFGSELSPNRRVMVLSIE